MGDPRHAGEFLQQIVRQTGRQMGRSVFGVALDQVLDPAHRDHCQVVSFRSGKLLLEIDSAPLYAELSGFHREELRLRLNAILTAAKVAQLQFRLGGTAHV